MPDHPEAIGDGSEAHVLAALRVDATRNGQRAGIRWAAQYELYSPE